MHKETTHTPSSSGMLAAIEEGLQRNADRRAASYDGILGLPPEWLPDPLRHEFEATRDDLLDNYTHEDIKAFLKSRTDERQPRFRWRKYCPPEITDKLDALLYIQHIVALGEEGGIKAYLGKGGQAVYRNYVVRERNQEFAKSPRGGALDELIRSLCKDHPTWRAVLKELKKGKGKGVIEEITEDTIKWIDTDKRTKKENTKYAAVSGIKDRVFRAKKRLKKL